MAAATAVFARSSAAAPLLHHHHRGRCRHNYSCGLATARSSPSRSSIRRHPTISSTSCGGYGRVPLVPASDHWGNWTFLLSTAALGLWSEKRVPAGKRALAGALVSVLLGLAASSAGVVAADAPAYRAALDYLLPLAVPLLLFRADLRRALRSTGAPLRAFLLGSVATAMGTAVAFRIVPMRSLGPDSWNIAVALMSRHIGGAFSYVAVCEILGVPPSTMEAVLAAANTTRALYFTCLFALAAKIPAEDSRSTGEVSEPPVAADDEMLPAAQSAIAVAAAFAICRAAKFATSRLGQFGIEGGASLPCAAATVVLALATFFPYQVRKLAPSDDALAVIMVQVFFAVVGANGSIGNAIGTAPSIFAFAFVQLAVHLLLTLGVGKLLGFDRKLLLVASAASVGGPTAACGVASAKGWTSVVAPAILASTFGIAIIASIGIGLGALFFYFFIGRIVNVIAIAAGTVIGLGGVALTFVGIGFRALAVKFMK